MRRLRRQLGGLLGMSPLSVEWHGVHSPLHQLATQHINSLFLFAMSSALQVVSSDSSLRVSYPHAIHGQLHYFQQVFS